jgi:spermidine/putrescine transport system permease protein
VSATTADAPEERVAVRTGFSPPPLLRRMGGWFLNGWSALVLVYLFLPVAVIVAFSFNEPVGKFNFVWKGFSLEAWKDPWKYPELVDALERSLKVAAVATLLAVVLGSLIAIALARQRFRGAGAIDLFLVIPLTSPEVVLGSSLLTLFLDFGWNLGFRTIVLAHVMFQISFVALTVKARLRGFDWSLEDAAMDLGANPTRTFLRITLPLIFPGIIAASMLSFALSLDDYIITLFTAGSTLTYPLYVNNASKTSLPPQINVLATMILVGSLVLIGLSALWQRRPVAGQVLTLLLLMASFVIAPVAPWALQLVRVLALLAIGAVFVRDQRRAVVSLSTGADNPS